MKKAFKNKSLSKDRLNLIEILNNVIDEYLRAGYRLTLRQLYYQTIARDLLPDTWIDSKYNRKQGLDPNTKNTQKNYKRLGELVNDAREVGLMDWDAIEDRGRNLIKNTVWTGPKEIIRAAYQSYRIDMWEDQPLRPEVWIEKTGLEGVVQATCSQFDVALFATRGYNSQSEAYAAGLRLRKYLNKGQTPVILHLGDHDPSGIDMTRDNYERLSLFTGHDIEVVRIALNYDQVLSYAPPPNPAKATDTRYTQYESIYGAESWELDALDPATINSLLTNALTTLVDQALWNERVNLQNEQREQLQALYENWDDVAHNLTHGDDL